MLYVIQTWALYNQKLASSLQTLLGSTSRQLPKVRKSKTSSIGQWFQEPLKSSVGELTRVNKVKYRSLVYLLFLFILLLYSPWVQWILKSCSKLNRRVKITVAISHTQKQSAVLHFYLVRTQFFCSVKYALIIKARPLSLMNNTRLPV